MGNELMRSVREIKWESRGISKGWSFCRGEANTDPLEKGCVNPGKKVFQDFVRTHGTEIDKSREDDEVVWR
jgi:hypothetical protein